MDGTHHLGGEPNKWKYRVSAVAVLTLLLASLAVGCLARSFNHDEAQFIASGALLAREGLLPYLHYPYFHLPNLVFIYAALFSTNDFLLLTARSFNLVCAWFLLLLVCTITASAFRFLGERRWLLGSGVALLLALHPLFRFTVGRAWNHDLPMLASVAALAAFLRAGESSRSHLWIAGSGLLLGLAAGTRLTYFPLLIPFLGLTYLYPSKKGEVWRNAFLFLIAFSLALLPTMVLLLAAPARFFFDNLIHNGPVNLRFRQATRPAAVTLVNRLLFPFRIMGASPSSVLLIVGFAIFGCWLPLRQGWRSVIQNRGSAALLALCPFALLGAAIPAPPYRQYYYSVVPFLLLGTVLGIAKVLPKAEAAGRLLSLLGLLIAIGLFELGLKLRHPGVLLHPHLWPVWEVHQKGREIQQLAGSGPILTLAPLLPLEGGSRIYPEFCTGSFTWRTAEFVLENERVRYGIVGRHDLKTFLTEKPSAILTGVEGRDLEQPLVDYARQNSYTKTRLPDRDILWLRPP